MRCAPSFSAGGTGKRRLVTDSKACYDSGMSKPKPNPLPDTEDDAFRAAVEKGMASLDAGKNVPYEDVRKWLQSWGTDKELPAPKCR